MKENTSPLMVTIRCCTYNHEPYIRQCLEGFVMQKTNFRFEAIVHDDASTDGTAAIIREYAKKYPDIIKPIFETENQYSKRDGSLRRIMDAHMHGKYIAMCEGDDYWIDPLKLQKQVDFLETHPDYGLVHTYFNYVDIEDRIISPPTQFYEQLQQRIFDGYIWDYYLCRAGFILTCTCIYRSSLYRAEENTYFDHGVFMMIARQSKVYCIREVTSCYRRNFEGAMCTKWRYYNELQRLVILYQIYYYLNGAPCALYYKKNYKVEYALKVAYGCLICRLYYLSKEHKVLLLKIACLRPSLLLSVFPFICKKFGRKLLKILFHRENS